MQKGWWLIGVGVLSIALAARGAVDPGNWRKYQTQHVTILSAASDKATRNWAIEFEQIYSALNKLFPKVGSDQPPLTVLLFKDRATFSNYTPMKDGQARDLAGYFTRVSDRGYVALNIADSRQETRRVIYHEAVHWFFSAAPRLRPVWLEEGLAELFSTARFTDQEFIYGDYVEESVRVLQVGSGMSIKQMLAVDHESKEYNESTRATRFYATSWAFLHYLVCGKEGGFPALGKFLVMLDEEMAPEEAFTRAFGRNYETMDRELDQYARHGKFTIFKAKFDRQALDRTLKAGSISADELNLELGYLLAIAQRLDQAKPLLEGLQPRLPDNPRVHEALGFLAVQAKDSESAQMHFGRALEMGSRSYYCHLGPAMAELAYRETRGGSLGSLSSGVARKILDGVEKAIGAEARKEEFYGLLTALIINAQPLTPLDGELIEQGARLYPTNVNIELGWANYARRLGRTAEALAIFDKIGATKRGIPPATRTNALNMARNIRIEDAQARYLKLMEAKDYAGAIPVVDERIALSPSAREINNLREHKAELENIRDILEAERLLKEKRFVEAEQLLTRLSSEAVGEDVRAQAASLITILMAQKAGSD